MKVNLILMRILLNLLMAFIALSTAASQTPVWHALGGPSGTRDVLALCEDADGHILVSTFSPDTVYRSSDDGLTWGPTQLVGREVYAFAASRNGSLFAAAWDVILRSADHGLHWDVVSRGQDSLNVSTICITPANTIFVGGWYKGILKSTDNGDTWRSAGLAGRTEIQALNSDNFGTLFAATSDSGVYRSTDNGSSWLRVDSLRFSVNSFTVNSQNEIFAAAHHGVIYRSLDAGLSWSRVSHGLPGQPDPALHPILACTRGDTLFVGTFSHGVYESTDHGFNWYRSKRFSGSVVVNAVLCTQRNSIMIGTDRAGVFRSSNGGLSWKTVGGGLGYLLASLASDSDGNIFAGTPAGVFISADQGNSWDNFVGVDSALTPYGVTGLATGQDRRLYVGTYYDGIFTATIPGASWTFQYAYGGAQFATVTPRNTVLFLSSYITVPSGYPNADIYRSTNNGEDWNVVYHYPDLLLSMASGLANELYATSRTRTFRSNDDGLTWNVVGAAGDYSGSKITVTPKGMVIIGKSEQLLRSADSGSTWQSLAGLGTPINVFFPTRSGFLYAATQYRGIFRSSDDGLTWTQINNGLTDSTIGSLALTHDGRLICSTLSHGIFRTIQPVVSVAQEHTRQYSFELSQNFPNPFNSRTLLQFSLPVHAFVDLRIFDSLGREIATLISGYLPAGQHTTSWDASIASSGIYFCRANVGEHMSTIKLVLLK